MTHDDLLAAISNLGDNADNLPRLLRQIAARLGVNPFVGAGLSIPLGLKGWREFLLGQAQKAGIESQICARLDAGEFERAAEEVFEARGPRAFLNAIDAEFGDAKLQGRRLDGAVSVLPRLAPGAVLTTNFDHVLERVFEGAGAKFERVVWGAKVTSAHGALTQDRRFLLKLHGDVDEQTDRILTRADYAKYYDAPDSLLRQILRRLFTARPVLFVGCSLAQDRWVQLLQEVTQADPTLEHFAIVEYPAGAAEYFTRQQFLSNHGITPIWFPHKRFDLIQPLLEYLVATPAASSAFRATTLAKRNRLLDGADDVLLAHATGFFGRTREVETVLQFLRGTEDMATVTPAREIYSVKGAPGIGKSEVCKEALQQFLRANPGTRVYYVELVDARDEAGLLTRLADAFGVAQATSRDEVLNALAAQPCLVYLDNLEDVLGDGGARSALAQLVALPHVRVLASSRAQLEQLAHNIPLRELDLDAAVKLFVSEWQKSASDNPLPVPPPSPTGAGNELREFVDEDLDCHALSIVLVAAQAYQAASLRELRERWNQDASRLAQIAGGRDKLSRLDVSLARSLAAVQSESESAIALTLWGLGALFPEGMAPAAFNAVTQSFAGEKFKAREILLRLSIIRVENDTLQILAPLRQFVLAKAKQGEAGLDADALLNTALGYFAELAMAAQQTELGDAATERGTALDRLLPEFPNLRECMVLAAQRGMEWAEPLGELSRALQNSYQFRALLSIEILRALLPLQQEANRATDAAHSFMLLAMLENRLGEIDPARTHYQHAIQLFTNERDNLGLANTLQSLGDLELALKHFQQADVDYGKARALYTAERDMMGLGYTDAELARVAHALNQTAQADQYLEEGMRAAQASNVPHVVQYVAQAASEIHPEWAQRALDPAAVEAELRRQTQDSAQIAAALGDLAYRLRMADRFANAEPFYRRALELDDRNPRRYIGLVTLLRQTSRDAEALPLAERWLTLAPDDADPPLALAALRRKLGRAEESARYLDAARRLAGDDAWYARACIESVAGNVDGAIEYLRRAAKDKEFDREWATRDPDLEWIRDDPRFKEIVGDRTTDKTG